MALAALFGRRKSPEEMLRQNQRALNKVRRGPQYHAVEHVLSPQGKGRWCATEERGGH
jgi:hypothetical protein